MSLEYLSQKHIMIQYLQYLKLTTVQFMLCTNRFVDDVIFSHDAQIQIQAIGESFTVTC